MKNNLLPAVIMVAVTILPYLLFNIYWGTKAAIKWFIAQDYENRLLAYIWKRFLKELNKI